MNSYFSQNPFGQNISHYDLMRKVEDKPLDQDLVDIQKRLCDNPISIDCILKVVCNYFNIPLEIVQSKTQKSEVVQTRQIAMYFSKNILELSLATIGSQIGGKEHATVLWGIRHVNNLLETDKRFRLQVDEIEKRLRS